MIDTILLDMDETLCDTTKANNLALAQMAVQFENLLDCKGQGEQLAECYRQGIYRELTTEQQANLLPIAKTSEAKFRHALIEDILQQKNIETKEPSHIELLQKTFDDARTQFFDFYPTIPALLASLRKHYNLVVITNGPEFSQVTKVERVNLKDHVDHILIGGLEPEEKPAASIFEKALHLANTAASKAIHIGDSLSTDIQGANNMGIQSIWVQHQQQTPSAAQAQPDFIIKHPQDLAKCLKDELHLSF